MAQEGHIVYKKCHGCDGTGISPQYSGDEYGVGEVVDMDCPICGGDKYLLWGWITKDDASLPDFLPEID